MATEDENISQSPTFISPSFSDIVTIKLNLDNYLLWQFQISTYPKGQDLYSYIDGAEPPPPTSLPTSSDSIPKPNLAYQAWK